MMSSGRLGVDRKWIPPYALLELIAVAIYKECEYNTTKQFLMSVLRTTKLKFSQASPHINPLWGRSSTPEIFEIAFCAALVISCPAFFLIPWSTVELFDGSIGKMLVGLGRSYLHVHDHRSEKHYR
jgi:hypothetical protein